MKTLPILCIVNLLSTPFLYGIGGSIGGTGTENDPFRIEDIEDFQAYCADSSYWAEGLHTRLESDLDLDPDLPGGIRYTQAPIAGDTDSTTNDWQGTPYSGSFDGNGHTLSNLTIDTNGQSGYGLGLFGQIARTDQGSITDLHLEAVLIECDLRSEYVGALIGRSGGYYMTTEANSILSDCTVSGLIKNTSTTSAVFYIGGLAGANTDGLEVINCHAEINIEIANQAIRTGGLFGDLNANRIHNSSAKGTISANDAYQTGGLSGRHKAIETKNCYADVSISAQDSSTQIGGLIGRKYPVGSLDSVIESYATGQIDVGPDSRNIGGFMGYALRANTTDCYSNIVITTGDRPHSVGGFVGVNSDQSHIQNCYATGSITLGEDAEVIGGFCGINGNDQYVTRWSIIIASAADISISTGQEANNIGGFCGLNMNVTSYTSPSPFPLTSYRTTDNYFEDCHAIGSITTGINSTNIGGFSANNTGDAEEGHEVYIACFWSVEGPSDSAGGDPWYDNSNPLGSTGPGWDFNTIWFSNPDSGTARLQAFDNDGDNMTDRWEILYLGNIDSDGTENHDGDSLLDIEEFRFGSSPIKDDTDDDQVSDSDEFALATDPTVVDTDGDGQDDYFEKVTGTDGSSASSRFQLAVQSIAALTASPANLTKTYSLRWATDLSQNSWGIISATPNIVGGEVTFDIPDLTQPPYNVPENAPVFFKVSVSE